MAERKTLKKRLNLAPSREDSEERYRQSRAGFLLRFGRYFFATVLAALVGYLYLDYIAGNSAWNTWPRIPVMVLMSAFLILSFTWFRKDQRGIRALYIAVLTSLVIMICTILLQYALWRPERFSPGIQGLLVVCFGAFIASAGGARVYVPMLFLPMAALVLGLAILPVRGDGFIMITELANPAALMLGICVGSEILERARRNEFLAITRARNEKAKFAKLLRMVLPRDIISGIVGSGNSPARLYENTTVMFTDFKDFTRISERTDPAILVAELDRVFLEFDDICEDAGVEKIKTIGDAYMCAGGVPREDRDHALHTCLSALRFRDFIAAGRGEIQWKIRIGVHSGSVMGGIVGRNRFSFDLWGDTVNVAARLEGACEPGRINISKATHDLVKDYFECEYRGSIEIKNRGQVEMYYLNGPRPEFASLVEPRRLQGSQP